VEEVDVDGRLILKCTCTLNVSFDDSGLVQDRVDSVHSRKFNLKAPCVLYIGQAFR
jgi:hypothetical protein